MPVDDSRATSTPVDGSTVNGTSDGRTTERDSTAHDRGTPGVDFFVDLQLRWGDMDAYRHVNNVEFLRLLEEARVRTLRAWASDDAVSRGAVVVARHEIDYRAQLHYRTAPVRVFIWVSRIGASGYDVAYVITDPDVATLDDVTVVYAAAETTLVFVDPDTGRARRITDTEREDFAAHAGPPAPLRSQRKASAR